jgi:hypothetical protein
MNSKQGFRKAKGDFLRAAAGTAVLIVTTMCASLWAGPAMAASDSGTPSASPTQPAIAQASVSLVNMALAVGGVLVAVMAVALTVDYGRRRIARQRAGGRRGGTHAKAPGSRAGGAIRSVTDPFSLDRPADADGYGTTGDSGLGPPDLPRPAGPPESEDEYPSWPGPPGPYALHPDHPSWPGRTDPRWPERQGPPWLDAAPPLPENGDRGSPGDRLALPSSGLQEDQGSGQHDAPGTHEHLHRP